MWGVIFSEPRIEVYMDYVCKVVGELSIEENSFNLRMHFNEIIDLYPDDFKVSPKLRAALRNREIEVYTPTLHKKAKRLNHRKKMELVKEKIIPINKPQHVAQASTAISHSEANEIKSALGSISNKMSSVVSRLDLLVTKVIESNNTLNANFSKFFNDKQSVNVNYNNPKLDSILDKVVNTQDKFNSYLEDQMRVSVAQKTKIPEPSANQLKEEKLDKLLDSVDKLLTDGLKIDGNNLNIHNTSGGGYSKISNEKTVQIEEDLPMFVPKIETDVSQKNIVTKSIESEGTDNILEKLKNLK